MLIVNICMRLQIKIIIIIIIIIIMYLNDHVNKCSPVSMMSLFCTFATNIYLSTPNVNFSKIRSGMK